MTQERKGFGSEAALNTVREECIERARGLGLSVLFNTTVFDGNFHEIPAVAAFFVERADGVRLASFQLQADTGRGTLRAAEAPITIDTVVERLRRGAGAPIAFDTPFAGHSACNRYAMTLVANGRVHDLLDDKAVLADVLAASVGVQFDRQHRGEALKALAKLLLRSPSAVARGLPWLARKLWRMRRDLVASRGRAHKLSFFIHHFMDAGCLECERIDACVFMVATRDGPISMCLHNAKRDEFILKPVRSADGGWWDPLSGRTGRRAPAGAGGGGGQPGVVRTRKTLKRRLRTSEAATGAAPPGGPAPPAGNAPRSPRPLR
jgi:hypothetical protein